MNKNHQKTQMIKNTPFAHLNMIYLNMIYLNEQRDKIIILTMFSNLQNINNVQAASKLVPISLYSCPCIIPPFMCGLNLMNRTCKCDEMSLPRFSCKNTLTIISLFLSTTTLEKMSHHIMSSPTERHCGKKLIFPVNKQQAPGTVNNRVSELGSYPTHLDKLKIIATLANNLILAL